MVQALAKFATILMCVNDMLGNKPLVQAALPKLKDAYARIAENRQQYPLVYECEYLCGSLWTDP